MATTEILAVGTSAADSSEFTVTAGVPVSVLLKTASSGPIPSGARAVLKVKSVGSTYHEVGALTGQMPSGEISAPGTYLLAREETKAAFGIDKSE